MTRPVDGPIMGRWADLRPRAAPKRPHGGIDIAAGTGTPIVAPEAGILFRFAFYRPTKALRWLEDLRDGGRSFPWGAYGYDIYGGVTVLQSADRGRVHLFCHSYFRQLWELTEPDMWTPQEQAADAEFPMVLWTTFAWPKVVHEGDLISRVGNQGESTGPHLHWEVHSGWEWTDYGRRPDPEKLMEG